MLHHISLSASFIFQMKVAISKPRPQTRIFSNKLLYTDSISLLQHDLQHHNRIAAGEL